MEVRNRFVSNADDSNVVRKLFAGNKHCYDELPYDFQEGATQSEHRAALLFAVATWIRNGTGAAERLAELAAVSEDDVTDIVQFAVDVCTRVLEEESYQPDTAAEVIAAGFVTEERFVDPDVPDDYGVTICELWDWSPFAHLRDGKPLEEDEVDPPSVLMQDVSLSGPLWAWLTVTVFVIAYCWLVAMQVGFIRSV